MIIRCLQTDDDSPGLTAGHAYTVIGIEAGDYRLLNDLGEPILYAPSGFEVIDAREPADWVSTTGDEGERYAYPPALAEPGFFEDYFNRRPEAVATFWQHVNQNLRMPLAG